MADINIFGPIAADGLSDSFGASDLASTLADTAPDEDLTVRINSPGGSVFEGLTMYQSLLNREGRVDVVIHGVAASIASIVAMAGDSITMGQASRIMIHNPLGPSAMAFGTADDLREAAEDTIKTANLLDSIKETLLDIYEARSGSERDFIASAMESETWLNAAASKKAGFTDYVTPNKTIEAVAWNTTPRAYAVKNMDELAQLTQLAQRIDKESKRTPDYERHAAGNRLQLLKRKQLLTEAGL